MRPRLRALIMPAVCLLALAGITAPAAHAAGPPTATFAESSDWGSGYQAQFTITNNGSSPLNGWSVGFDLPSGTSVGTYWDALETASGSHYVFTNRDYNGSIAPGASASFGFVASGSGAPTGCTLNGAACDGGSPGGGGGGGTGGGSGGGGTGGGSGGGGLFSPYVDITMASPTLKDVANATGQKHFTLAFALAGSTGCTPSWGGTIPLNDSRVIGEVNDLKSVGGDVTVATGGAMGPYLENTCGSASALLAAYEQALDAVGSNRLDVDVEASIPVAQVNTALKQLQSTRGTAVTYTLRVQAQDYGVDPFSVQILQDAASRGLNVTVNPMLMDFGYTGSWGDALVSAANATLGQMRQVWPGKSDAELKGMLGLTPMIGKNDTGPVTTQDVARRLLSYAQSNHVGYLGFWSVGRDNGGCANGSVSPTCSGIAQSTYEFTGIFKGFTG